MSDTATDLTRCMQALKSAKSDNEKFAALMMVTKLCKPEECDRESRQQLLEAISLKFLSRLLHSKTVPEGCPEQIYKSLALNILSSFCSDPEIAGRPEMKQMVPIFNKIVLLPLSEKVRLGVQEIQMVLDNLTCLLGMAASPAGCNTLVEGRAVPGLIQVITENALGSSKAMEVLLLMIQSHGPLLWTRYKAGMHSLFACFTEIFVKTHDASKFHMCDTLMCLFSSLPKDFICPPYPQWMFDLMRTLETIFKNKLGQTQRDPALRLLSAVVACLGLAPLLPPMASDEKIMFLITHLACIEVRMTLENTTAEQIQAKADVLCACYVLLEAVINHMISGQSLSLGARQVQQLHAALRGAFSAILFLLSEVQSKNLVLPLRSTVMLTSVRALSVWMAEETNALRNEVYAILPFLLSLCHTQMDSDEEEQLAALTLADNDEDGQDPSRTPRAIEDSTEPSDTASPEDSRTEKQGTEPVEDPKADDSHPTTQTDSNGAGSTEPGQHTNCDHKDCGLPPSGAKLDPANMDRQLKEGIGYMGAYILRYLLPGLCHLSSEEKGREILVKENFPELLVGYLESQVPGLINTDANLEDERDSLATACGVFMNFAVMEPKLVSTHASFHRLLDILLQLLPQTVYQDSLLVLTAHFATLGMMLLRRQASRTDQASEARQGFVWACVTFLNRAHMSRTQRGTFTVKLCDNYQAVWHSIEELWFLTLQTLIISVATVEEVVPAVLKSGWLQTLVKILQHSKGNTSLGDLQDNLLSLVCALASNNATARTIVKDADGLALARMYDSKDLEKALKS